MYGEREKVAAGNEGFAFVAILYTGVTDNKCGLSKVLRRAFFVGIMNSISVLQHPSPWVDNALRTIGAWGGVKRDSTRLSELEIDECCKNDDCYNKDDSHIRRLGYAHTVSRGFCFTGV